MKKLLGIIFIVLIFPVNLYAEGTYLTCGETQIYFGDHKGYEGAPGEKNVVKAKKTFAQLRGGGSSKRKADKTQGDMAMKKVKEEFELNEAMVAEDPMLMRTLTKMASSRTPMPMKFKKGQPMTVDQDQAKTLLKGLKKVKGPSLKAMARDITSSPADFMKALAFADKAR